MSRLPDHLRARKRRSAAPRRQARPPAASRPWRRHDGVRASVVRRFSRKFPSPDPSTARKFGAQTPPASGAALDSQMRKDVGCSGVVRARLVASPIIVLLVLLLVCGAASCSRTKPGVPELRAELLALEITEIHYHPLDEGTESGDEYEFVELKNTGEAALTLDDVGFDEGIQYTVPAGTILAPGTFLVVAATAAANQDRYGFAPSGQYAGRLANTGERITLSDSLAHAAIVSLAYLDASPWPAAADGLGRSLVPVTANLDDILAHTDLPQKESVELFNPNDSPLDVSGWFLTDDDADPEKYRIPPGTILPARGFAVFDSDDFGADPDSPLNFLLSEHGEQIYLVADAMGCAIAYCDGVAFGDQDNGVAFGRHVISTGDVHLVSLESPTLGSENAAPAVGPLVISEVMYHPPVGGDEYIELQNIGTTELPLSEASRPDHTWKIDGIGFAFPPSITLAPGETVLVVPSAVPDAAFRDEYGVPADVRIFTKTELLGDYGDELTVMKPAKPYGNDLQPTLPFILQETVAFSHTAPWPAQANGTGSALHRKNPRGYGNDPSNWEAGAPTPGRGR